MGHMKGISHVAYTVRDFEKSVDFYCSVLEFEKAFEIKVDEGLKEMVPDHPALAYMGKAVIAYLKAPNGDFIELFRPLPNVDLTGGGPNYDGMGYSHLSLVVDNLKEFAEVLQSKGVTLDSDISKGPDNTYTLWIKDPDGNRIELMEYTKESWQVIYG